MNTTRLILIAAGVLMVHLTSFAHTYTVQNEQELAQKLQVLQAGDSLLLDDGVYSDEDIIITNSGTPEAMIFVGAKHPGQAFVSGNTKVELRGKYIHLSGLYFKDGQRDPSEWKTHGPGLVTFYGSNNRLSECAFHAFDQANSSYVATFANEEGVYPQYCRIDHCSFTEKVTFDQVINLNNTPRKILAGEPAAPMYHRIDHCLFSNPKKPGNAGGGIRIGYWRKDYGRCLVDSCLFVRQDSEPEIVTSKSSENVFYANTVINCQGTLNFRHGDRQVALNNFFIGNDSKREAGGMFIWGSDHLVACNYFELPNTIKSRGNAAIYLNPGAEQTEHALAYNVEIANNVFNNIEGGAVHFNPLKDRRIETCKAKGLKYKEPYNITLSGNVFHNDNDIHTVTKGLDKSYKKKITFADNVSDYPFSAKPKKADGVSVVKGKMNADNLRLTDGYPTPFAPSHPPVEGIDLDFNSIVNAGLQGQPLTENETSPTWMSKVPGTYFYTGKLSKETQKAFDAVLQQRKKK